MLPTDWNRVIESCFYTDGIVEASNASGDLFGHNALCESLKNTIGLSPAKAADTIILAVRQWAAKQEDDLTVGSVTTLEMIRHGTTMIRDATLAPAW